MLEAVQKKYGVTGRVPNQEVPELDFVNQDKAFAFVYPLLKDHGGEIYAHGLFHMLTFEGALKWNELMTAEYFSDLNNQLYCFAITWQGCVMAINLANDEVYLFDPATAEYFSIEDTSLAEFWGESFHEIEHEAFYPEDFQATLSALGLRSVPENQGIGHKISLFLGGKDEMENLELIDTEVLWETQIQIAETINEIPE